MNCELGHFSRPDGVATFTCGDSCATAAVYGPADVRINKELIDRATVEVIYKPKTGLPGCPEKLIEKLMRNTCESIILSKLHPRSSITIIIQEMQNSGSFLSCCINSMCLALLDASINLKCLMAAVSCIMNADGDIVLNPNHKEETLALGSLTFIFENQDKKIISCSSKGCFSMEQYNQCLAMCTEASSQIFQFYTDTMQKKICKLSE